MLVSKAAHPNFLYTILPRRSHLIQVATFDLLSENKPIADTRHALSLLLLLPNLSTLVLNESAVIKLLGKPPYTVEPDERVPTSATSISQTKALTRNAERQHRRQTIAGFRTLVSRVHRLEIQPHTHDLTKIIGWSTNLRELVLPYSNDYDATETDTAATLASRNGLHAFTGTIVYYTITDNSIWSTALTMRSLNLRIYLSSETWSFVCQFVNLESLRVDLEDPNDVFDAEDRFHLLDPDLPRPAHLFPRLHRVQIGGASVMAFAHLFFSELQTAVTDLILDTFAELTRSDELFSILDTTPPSMGRLELSFFDPEYAPDVYVKLNDFCHNPPARNIQLVVGKGPQKFPSKRSSIDDVVCDAEELFGWAGRRLEYLSTINDLAAAEQVRGALSTLWGLRRVQSE